jgi:cytochrome P450
MRPTTSAVHGTDLGTADAAGDLDAVDLADPALFAHGDPHRVWRVLRRHDPVHWQDGRDRPGFWSVTKLADAEAILRDHRTFTSERGVLLDLVGTDDPAGGHQLAVTDPPRHTRIRAVLQQTLAARAGSSQVTAIRARVQDCLAAWPDGDVFDLAMSLAPLPTAIMGDLMGLPAPDWPMLARLTSAAVAPADPEYQTAGGIDATRQHAYRQLFVYLQEQVVRRRRASGDDLISLLLTAEVDGRRLEPSEVVSNSLNLILGANVTTPHVLPALLLDEDGIDRDGFGGDQPGRYRAVATRPHLLDSAVEEALRWASPTNHFLRYAVRDTEIRGTGIRAGDAVVVWFGSANRDEDAFADPYTFNPRRRPNRHLAFGVGPHYCVGHSIARTTVRVLFSELVDRFEDLVQAGPVQHLHSNLIAGVTHLSAVARRRRGRTARPASSAGLAAATPASLP